MEILTLFLIALGLSLDSFAVSIASGCIKQKISFFSAMRIAFSLAFFQGLLPVGGWFLGKTVINYVVHFDHWIAFGILLFIGLKMVIESIRNRDEQKCFDPQKFWVLISISVATSIDALVVGFGFGLIDVNIILAMIIIGAVTFIASMLGILFGKKAGFRFGKKMETAGGIVLILIGTKILLEHLFF